MLTRKLDWTRLYELIWVGSSDSLWYLITAFQIFNRKTFEFYAENAYTKDSNRAIQLPNFFPQLIKCCKGEFSTHESGFVEASRTFFTRSLCECVLSEVALPVATLPRRLVISVNILGFLVLKIENG